MVAGLSVGCGDNKPSTGGLAGGGGAGGGGGVGGSGGGPACTISKPTITATHPVLNGVPVANGGDNVSSPGGAYEVAFEVTTAIEDGQPVTLKITNTATPTVSTTAAGTATSGKATFAGVPLVPDGSFTVVATCTNAAGVAGHSAATPFKVDSMAPDLTVSSPVAGQFIGPADLVAGAFKVCAQTTATDAVALPSTLGAAALNLSVAVGTASPDTDTGFVAVTAVATDACVNVLCPSNSPVDLTVTLKDGAGNSTTKVVSNVSCATTLPGVLIISPTGDATPFADPTKHLLAANSTNTLKDQDAVTAGAQFTVVACSDTAGSATLKVGAAGGTLTALGTAVTTVAAVTADNCPTGHTQVAKFTNVTLPESALKTDGTLSAATGLEVDVQVPVTSAIGASPEVDLWVASVSPTVADSATPICNTSSQSTTAVTKDVTLLASTASVVLTATPASGTAMTYMAPTFVAGSVTFTGVSFPLGATTLTAVASDKAGNTASLTQPCVVSVGTPPVVTFTAPATGKSLCAAGATAMTCIADADGTMAGWQGPVTVSVLVGGVAATTGTVTFTASSATAPLGTATITAGVATLASATIPDGNPVTITATTSSLGVNGVGVGTRMVVVATGTQAAPTMVQSVVKVRRQSSFTVTWKAPMGAAGYDLRYAETPISTVTDFSNATVVPITGTPLAAGMTESRDVPDLTIEHDYYFAIVAKDAAGNSSVIASATPSPVPVSCTTPPCPIRASFNQTIVTGPQAIPANYAGFGYYVDGSGNFTGDSNTDILVGEESGFHAYMFAGSSTFAPTTPTVTFQSAASTLYFGGSIANIGDVDGDGLEDIAVSSTFNETQPKVFIFKGRTTAWPATVLDTAADYVITADVMVDSSSILAYPIVKMGDINGDGIGDFALGADQAVGGNGALVVILGGMPFGSGTLSTRMAANKAFVLTNTPAAGLFGASATVVGASSGTLVVGATAAMGGAGELVSYKWNAGALAIVGTPFVGGAGENIGTVLNFGGGGLGVISGNTQVPGAGAVLTFLNGTASAPLSGTPTRFMDAGENGADGDTFGTVALGGGFSGSNVAISYVGDSKPDLVLGGAIEGSHSATLYILDGAKAATLPTPSNIDALATAKVRLPTDWRRSTLYSSPVQDIDGDGYGDIAVGETDNGNFSPAFQGRVLVLW
ncbi:MAG TPA: FG-GAP-like repeat-containing protein [Polyangia bacterium]